ncbi:MAG: hypothetical protein KUG79_10060 [Pseudomonadales bacterium]|nr:hypothetical protein [Pseudomonadales bacterium]
MLNSLDDSQQNYGSGMSARKNPLLDMEPKVSLSRQAMQTQVDDTDIDINRGTGARKHVSNVDLSSFDSILDGAKKTQKVEKTVASILDGLNLEVSLAARVRSCRRIDELVDQLALMIKTDVPPASGIKAFVGPAGSGKSTCLIKLITRHVMQFGASSCAIINCDRYRAGAKENLTRLGELLDVEVLHVQGEFSLDQAITQVAHRQLVVIDLPGLSRLDEQLKQEMSRLAASRYDIRRYLVLPANLQIAAMHMATQIYADTDRSSCILTRLDECDSLGPALSFIIQRQLPLAFTSNGTHIPEDITAARSLDFVHTALELLDKPQDYFQFAELYMSDFNYSNPQSTESNNMVMDV